MKLKPIVKVNESKNYLTSWIIEKFPENYKELTYVEPFLGSGSVLLNKEPSVEEVGNESNIALLRIWQSMRDEHKLFISKLKRIDCKESTFLKYKNKKETDYLNAGVVEFVLRQMSKSGLKKSYLPIKRKRKEHCWQDLFNNAGTISSRIKNLHLLNKNAAEVIRAFGGVGTLIYCDVPSVESGVMSENEHIEVGEALVSIKGKAIVTAHNNAMYKRIYSSWNRKGIPGKPKESAWFNF